MWRETLVVKGKIRECMTCDMNYEYEWKGAGGNLSLRNVWEMVRPRWNKDPTTARVWISSIPKVLNLLWGMKNGWGCL